jgi:hypothetical protein
MSERKAENQSESATSTNLSLLPYSGSPIANPAHTEHVPNTTSNYCNIDQSGKIEYRYNSLGFRGEEYNEKARFHIFVCGPSEDFGLGINEKDTWFNHFKLKYAQLKQVDPLDVNLLNFSQNGASMDYIARVIVSQCQRVKPDLVLSSLTFSSRTEYFSDESDRYYTDRAITLTPNMHNTISRHDEKEYFKQRTSFLSEDELDELLMAMEGYYSYYSNRVGLINRLKNILLIQQFCSIHDIPLVLWSLHRYSLEKDLNMPLPQSIRALSDCIDHSRIYTHEILHPDHQKAADGRHPGPEIHQAVADQMWQFYNRLYVQR